MKRSEINNIIKESINLLNENKFKLPPFAYWSPKDWETKGSEYDEIRDNNLGWDITDYGFGDFKNKGLVLFTIRNGNPKNDKYTKTYAEKIMIVGEGQVTPYHFHWHKMEDIINRGGGNLMIRLYNSNEDGSELLDTPVIVNSDGREYEVPAGGIVRLMPGESITLHTGQYHSFWGEEGTGTVIVGEVSQVNDDASDNRFFEKVGRFPTIEEDVEPEFYLCNEYPRPRGESN
ncbi:MAG: D-lyxose/D-mannose family sugar isomerase [Clostridiales bacterium]|nr:D-lyxose/D-mannose family sugar isomerase [Clostridiales bacterium]